MKDQNFKEGFYSDDIAEKESNNAILLSRSMPYKYKVLGPRFATFWISEKEWLL